MARVECSICGKLVTTTANNYVFANGLHQHKKCPRTVVLSEEDKIMFKKLTDRIQQLAIKHDKALNWRLISAQIKRYKEDGFSYSDQLFTLNFTYEKDDNIFWGYGRVEKFFYHAMDYKERLNKYQEKKEEINQDKPKQETKVIYKPRVVQESDVKKFVYKPSKKKNILNF